MRRRARAPSGGVNGAGLGAALGVVVDILVNLAGHPLPPGSASALAGALAYLVGYFTRGGRRGEAD